MELNLDVPWRDLSHVGEETTESSSPVTTRDAQIRRGAQHVLKTKRGSAPECSKLLHSNPGLGTQRVSYKHARSHYSTLHFDGPLRETMSVFYRYSGRSRHSTNIEECARSVVQALRGLPPAQASVTTFTVLLNSPDNASFSDAVSDLLNVSDIHTSVKNVPGGNEASYAAMMKLIVGTVRDPNTIVFLLEEDYFVQPTIFLRTAEFFKAYNPCMMVPYDYPDRYLLESMPKQETYNTNIILVSPGMHWRTVTGSTVTFVMRMRTLLHPSVYSKLPNPSNDYDNSIYLSRKIGMFAPIPSLSSHVHAENPGLLPFQTSSA